MTQSISKKSAELQIRTIFQEAWKNVKGVKAYYFIGCLIVLALNSVLVKLIHVLLQFLGPSFSTTAVYYKGVNLWAISIEFFPLVIPIALLSPLAAGLVCFGVRQANNKHLVFNSLFAFYQKRYILHLFLAWLLMSILVVLPFGLIEYFLGEIIFKSFQSNPPDITGVIPLIGFLNVFITLASGVSVLLVWPYPIVIVFTPLILIFAVIDFTPSVLSAHTIYLISGLTTAAVLIAIYGAVIFYLVYPLIIEKNLSAWKALITSASLVHKNFFKIFRLLACLVLINPGPVLLVFGFFLHILSLSAFGIILYLGSFLWTVPFTYNVLGITYRELAGISSNI